MNQPADEKGLSLVPIRNRIPSSVLTRTDTCPRRDGGPSFELAGDVDISVAPQVGESLGRLLVGPRRTIRVDLSGVTFMDSGGIGACLRAQERARLAGYEMVFVNPSSSVALVIKILGLEPVLLQGLP
jgi:anti-sigma B factor antagonist